MVLVESSGGCGGLSVSGEQWGLWWSWC